VTTRISKPAQRRGVVRLDCQSLRLTWNSRQQINLIELTKLSKPVQSPFLHELCHLPSAETPSDCVTGIELSTRSSLISDCSDCSVGGVEVGAGVGVGGSELRFLTRER